MERRLVARLHGASISTTDEVKGPARKENEALVEGSPFH